MQQGPAKEAPVALETAIGAEEDRNQQKFQHASASGSVNQAAPAHWAMNRHKSLSFATGQEIALGKLGPDCGDQQQLARKTDVGVALPFTTRSVSAHSRQFRECMRSAHNVATYFPPQRANSASAKGGVIGAGWVEEETGFSWKQRS